MWVRPCSALIIADMPSFEEDSLAPGIPQNFVVDVREMVRGLPEAELASFPGGRRAEVREMLASLNSLSWERFIVHFPYEIAWSGAAHSKICQHAFDDPGNHGVHVVEDICRSFLLDKTDGSSAAFMETLIKTNGEVVE